MDTIPKFDFAISLTLPLLPRSYLSQLTQSCTCLMAESLLRALEMNKADKSHILYCIFLQKMESCSINKYKRFPMSLHESTNYVIHASTTATLYMLILEIHTTT